MLPYQYPFLDDDKLFRHPSYCRICREIESIKDTEEQETTAGIIENIKFIFKSLLLKLQVMYSFFKMFLRR